MEQKKSNLWGPEVQKTQKYSDSLFHTLSYKNRQIFKKYNITQ